MTEPNQPADNQNPNEAAPLGNQSSEGANEQLENANNPRSNTITTKRHPKIIKLKKWVKRENKETGGIANIIAFIALIIGGFLAVYTYKVFKLGQDQSQSIIDAGYAAKRSVEQDSSQFLKLNEPFLQIEDYSVDIKPGMPVIIKAKLANLGNFPVKIISYKMFNSIKVSPPINGFDSIKSVGGIPKILNAYISKESPFSMTGSQPAFTTTKNLNALKLNKAYFWFGGVFVYQNLITDDIKTYKYLIRTDMNHGELLINDNKSGDLSK